MNELLIYFIFILLLLINKQYLDNPILHILFFIVFVLLENTMINRKFWIIYTISPSKIVVTFNISFRTMHSFLFVYEKIQCYYEKFE